MDETILKCYLESVMKVQDKYGWIMDSYVLDFFTKGWWQHLPSKWTDVLAGLMSGDIATYLLEMYSTRDGQTSHGLTFRKVWPLELLAFLAACHYLNLQNQPWTSNNIGTNPIQVHSQSAKKLRESVKQTSNFTHTNCTGQKVIHNEKHELSSTQINAAGKGTQTGPLCAKLDHAFRCNVKPKKQHEIQVLSEVICKQAEELQCWNIVDVGAGLGHLSRLLSYGYKFHVVTVEGDGCHKKGAEKLDRKVQNNLQKQHTKTKEQLNESGQSTSGSLIHLTHHINADIPVEQFARIVSEAFSKMELQTNDSTTYGHLQSSHNQKSCQNFLIVGLHTCGDLASTLLRVFTQCKNAVGIVLVGCCYMKLSHEVKSGPLTAAQDMTGITKGSLKTLGYPMSEYLKSCASHRQSYNGLEAACHALGRYYKKLVENSPSLKLHYYRALLELLLQLKDPNSQRRQIRYLNTKKAAKMTFEEYVKNACKILGMEKECPTLEEIHRVEELYQGKENDVVVFYVLRLLLAPLIEGLILVDRLFFVKESYPNINARTSLLFHPDLSPRNMAIIAEKSRHP